MMFILHSSKTYNKGNKPQVIKINSKDFDTKKGTTAANIAYCPFQVLRQYIKIRKGFENKNEKFFIFRDKTLVTGSCMRTVLRKLLVLCGCQGELYGTHSLRAGRSVDLLAMGVPVETIKKLGRWKSKSVYVYLS